MGRRTLLQMIAECHKNRTVNHELKNYRQKNKSRADFCKFTKHFLFLISGPLVMVYYITI